MGLFSSFQQRLHRYRHRFFINHVQFGSKGRHVTLFNGSYFEPPENIHFGNGIYIGPEAYFWAEAGRIILHDNVIFGPRVSVFTTQHKWRGAEHLPFGYDSEYADVEIFPNAWIGLNCMVLPGVRVGEGAICAAGSVIHRNVPPLALVAGNPAEIKGYREPAEYLRLKQAGRLWVRDYHERGPEPFRFHPRPPATEGLRHSARALEQRAQYGIDELKLEG